MAKDSDQVRTESKLTRILILLGLLLFVGAGAAWWTSVGSNPRNVFYDMLDNSMKTRSIGRHVVQDNGSQKLEQRSHLITGQTAQVNSLTTLSQGAGTSVKTQSIGTPTEDFVRYVAIETDQLGASGQPLNFDNVIGVWGKSTPAEQGEGTRGELFGENVLGVIPIGFVPYERRVELIKLIDEQNVYDIDYSKTKREVVNGRPQYTYDVVVKSDKYITMLKEFAKSVGLTQLESLDPSSFADAEPFQFSMTVDILSRQLVSVAFTGSARTEVYSSHGHETSVTLPDQTIPIDELQARLQNIQ